MRSDTWFRRVGKVAMTRTDGTQVSGFGAVLPYGNEKENLWGERSHLLGRLPGPLYRFVGSFPELIGAAGAKLTQGDTAYRVLRSEMVEWGGQRLYERALLERWEENDQ